MPGNSYGEQFQITTFGESHGPAMGVVIDGCPAGLSIDMNAIQADMDKRRPGQSSVTTERQESDTFEILSGVFEEVTTGAPIAMLIRNKDQRPSDYDHLKGVLRPGHADYTYLEKYGHVDHRGGGRASARETACRVMAGAIAKQLLANQGLSIHAWTSQVGDVLLQVPHADVDASIIESSIVRCPDEAVSAKMEALILAVKEKGDSVGGQVSCIVQGVPAGLGEPVFDRLEADLAKGMMSINAAKGFSMGSGFAAAGMQGSEHNDVFESVDGKIQTRTNQAGGVLGGITNGMPIWFDVAFKPPSTLMTDQETIDKNGAKVTLEGKGRHDPCVVPRAVPVVEAMAAITLADHWLRAQTSKI
jgi:chorismate synthase